MSVPWLDVDQATGRVVLNRPRWLLRRLCRRARRGRPVIYDVQATVVPPPGPGWRR